MNFTFEKYEEVGIFKLAGHLTSDHEDELKLLLMRAVYSIDRAVLNLKEIIGIDARCLRLLRKAYCMSVRLKNPIILTEVPEMYISEIFNCEINTSVKQQSLTDQGKDAACI